MTSNSAFFKEKLVTFNFRQTPAAKRGRPNAAYDSCQYTKTLGFGENLFG